MCADNDRARGVETCAEMWRGITVRKVRPGNGQPQMGENLNCIRRQKRANAVFEKLKLVFEGDKTESRIIRRSGVTESYCIVREISLAINFILELNSYVMLGSSLNFSGLQQNQL